VAFPAAKVCDEFIHSDRGKLKIGRADQIWGVRAPDKDRSSHVLIRRI
jgi:hypothetical protein